MHPGRFHEAPTGCGPLEDEVESTVTAIFLPGAATPALSVTRSSLQNELSERAEGAESGPAGWTRPPEVPEKTPAGPRACGLWWRCGSDWGCHTVPDIERETRLAAQLPAEPHSVPCVLGSTGQLPPHQRVQAATPFLSTAGRTELPTLSYVCVVGGGGDQQVLMGRGCGEEGGGRETATRH